MRKCGIPLAALLLAAVANAQEGGVEPEEQAERRPEDQSLEKWRALELEFQAAQKKFYDRVRAKEKVDWSEHPQRTFVPRLLAFAEEHEGTEGAREALLAAFQGADRAKKLTIAKTLVADHLESAQLGRIPFQLRYVPGGDEILRTLHEKSPHRAVRGRALLSLAQAAKDRGDADAEKLFQKVIEDFADVDHYGKRTLGDAAKGALFEMRNLSVGKKAPDIVGKDLEGQEFKLSDYQGKVVVIDFWGDW